MKRTTADLEQRGVIVLGPDGTTVLAAGAAAAPRVGEAAKEALCRLRQAAQRLVCLEVDAKDLLLLRVPAGDRDVGILLPVTQRDPFVEFVNNVDFAFEILNHFLTNPFEAMTVVDGQARLAYTSPVHERFFGWRPGEGIGRPVTEMIENTRLHEVVRRDQAEIGRIQSMRGACRIVNRFPIHRDGQVVGAIGQVMFKSPEQVHNLSRELADLKAEVDYYRRELDGLRRRAASLDDIVGESEPIRQLKADIQKVAPLDMPVLLVGESGTGKELVAGALHNLSNRSAKSMIILNSAALPANLVESELFGYEVGAFTGANRKGQAGKFELADRSSLFLDEIGDMPLEVQAKFLRVLEDGIFERLGGHRSRRTDCRLISATNRDLSALIDQQKFRADLYFRIGAVSLRLPPLRERLDDVPMLVRSLLGRVAQRYKLRVNAVAPRAYEVLARYHWPGNVRELFHEVQKAAIFCDGSEIGPEQFAHLRGEAPDDPVRTAPGERKRLATVREATARLERDMVQEAVRRHNGNKKRAAAELGVSRTYLYKKLEEIGPVG